MKKLIIFALALVCLLGVFCMVSFADEDVNAPYYDKVYTAADGTPLALYDKEEVEGVTTYYPLVWFAFDTTNDAGETVTTYVKVRYDDANPYTREASQGRFNAVSYNYTYTDGAGEEQTVALNNSNVVLLNLRDAYIFQGTTKKTVKNFESNGNDKAFTRMEALYLPITIGSVANRSSGWAKLRVFDLPENITQSCQLSTQLFNGNKVMKELYLPSNVNLSAQNSFCKGATGLQKVTFGPNYKGKLPSLMFSGCTSLVEFNQNGATFTQIDQGAFDGCNNSNLVISLDLTGTTSIGSKAFNGCTKLTLSNCYLENVTSIGEYAFQNCKNITYIKTGEDLTSVGIQAFNGCTGLLAVDMSACTNTNVTFGWGAFYGCSNLYAVQFPAKTTTMSSRIFSGCGNLRALYLPDVLTKLDGNKDDHGPFAYCYELYFVNEEIDIDDYFVDGEFSSTYYLANLPEKPQVYYFPKTLTTIHSNTQVFRHTTGINDVLVFDKNLTKIETGGLFLYAGNTSAKKVVFLGDIEVFKTGDNRKNVSFYFANPADTDFASIGITGGSTNNNANSYIYFCANGDCYDYSGTSDGRATQAKRETSPLDHLYLVAVDKEAECTKDGVKGFECFCGKADTDPARTQIIPMLGHLKGELVAVKYEKGFLQVGYAYHKCEREGCGVESYTNEELVLPAIFNCNGYSASEMDGSIIQGFVVNREMVQLYSDVNGEITFGLVAAVYSTKEGYDTTSGKLFTSKGVRVHDKVAVCEFTDRTYDVMEMAVIGLGEYPDVGIYCCLYYTIGDNVYYINEGVEGETTTAKTVGGILTTDALVPEKEEE